MAQQITKVRTPGGEVMRLADWTSSEPLYSTVEVNSGPFTVLQAFSYGRGDEVPGSPTGRKSDYEDTNLRGQGGKLPEDEALLLHSLGIEVFATGAGSVADVIPQPDGPHVGLPNMLRLQRDIVVITKISAVKQYTHHPLSWFPAGSGVCEVNSDAHTNIGAGATGFVAANNGGDSPADQRPFASPLMVQGGDPFTVDFIAGPGEVQGLSLGAPDDRMLLRVTCNGPRKRPIA